MDETKDNQEGKIMGVYCVIHKGRLVGVVAEPTDGDHAGYCRTSWAGHKRVLQEWLHHHGTTAPIDEYSIEYSSVIKYEPLMEI